MSHEEVSDVVRRALLRERESLVLERAKLTRGLDAQIAVLDKHLAGDIDSTVPAAGSHVPAAHETLRPVPITRSILDTGKALILPGVFVTTEQVYQTMAARGIVFPQDGKTPSQRITKALSATGLYKGSKSRGWSLKGEDPPAGRPVDSSGATKS